VREKRAPFSEVGEISSWLFGEEPFSITINVDYFFANFKSNCLRAQDLFQMLSKMIASLFYFYSLATAVGVKDQALR
jgi:hypothetical protein